jgi:iron(III) transport system substrate-binding protein
VGVLRSARHPAAALLFADWLLAEGQEVIVELGRDAARRDLATAPQAEQIMVDASALVADEEEWRDRFERLLRGATQGEQSD